MAARRGGPRHLVFFVDGTWLWSGSDKNLDVYSNIWRMNLLLDADDDNGRAQIVHYSRGLGAVDEAIEAYAAGGLGYGIDELIADLYVNICSNYQRGDKIYIFGFSRGAVVARALTGLLSYGILEADRINMFAHVWAAYTNQSGEVLLPGAVRAKIDSPNERRFDYSSNCSERHPRIEFVGVFDTVVGGDGVAKKVQRLRLADCKVQPNVKHAVQLLAIDESRKFFQPVFWTGVTDPKTVGFNWRPATLEQIWMPGVHSDVGGAYGKRHLGNLALQTMIDRVVARTSLKFDRKACRELQVVTGGDPVRIHDEFENGFKFLGQKMRAKDANAPQLLHPFVEVLERSNVSYKSEKNLRTYTRPESLIGMDKSKEFRSDIFSGNCGVMPKARGTK